MEVCLSLSHFGAAATGPPPTPQPPNHPTPNPFWGFSLQELHTGLAEQQPVVERLTGATAVTHDQLGKLAQEARRI